MCLPTNDGRPRSVGWLAPAALLATAALWLLPAAHAADTGKPPAGEEYITASAGGAVHPPTPGPDRRADEGKGPFHRLVIRGATLIDGTGAPPLGPVDIVVEQDRIVRIASVGYPKVPIKEKRRPEKGDYAENLDSITRAVSPYVTFTLSEFNRFRLQYENLTVPGDANEHRVFLQWTVILGPHGAHAF